MMIDVAAVDSPHFYEVREYVRGERKWCGRHFHVKEESARKEYERINASDKYRAELITLHVERDRVLKPTRKKKKVIPRATKYTKVDCPHWRMSSCFPFEAGICEQAVRVNKEARERSDDVKYGGCFVRDPEWCEGKDKCFYR